MVCEVYETVETRLVTLHAADPPPRAISVLSTAAALNDFLIE